MLDVQMHGIYGCYNLCLLLLLVLLALPGIAICFVSNIVKCMFYNYYIILSVLFRKECLKKNRYSILPTRL